MNPRKHIENKVNDFVVEVMEDIEEAEKDGEYLVVKNPNNKRIKHIINPSTNPIKPNKKAVSGLRGLCNQYRISGAALFRLEDDYDDLSEFMTKSKIEDEPEICKNCEKQLD